MAQDPLLIEYHGRESFGTFVFAVVHRVVLYRSECLSVAPCSLPFLDLIYGICQSLSFFKAMNTKLFGASVLNKLDEEHSDSDAREQFTLPLMEQFVLLC